MSESGDTAPCQHHENHDRRRCRRRCVLIWFGFTVLILLLVAAAAAIAALAMLHPRDPTTELLSINATGATPRVVAAGGATGGVSVELNVTFLLAVRVRNPNPASFRHGAATTSLVYRGVEVGAAAVPAGTVPSRGEETLRLDMTVEADRVVAAAGVGGIIGDVLAGEMEFEARTEVRGTVRLLGLVRRSAVARSLCRVVVGVVDVKVRRQECHNESKL
uniref:Late embryogenesis abundant protein LEA-2 subgroup domain-containing protein n=1 Tax=Leersia perrieri TaxID=77586 RepID=A0A0D9WHU1_9ORYZ